MDGEIIVELAGGPKGKGRPRFSRATGHTYTDAKTRSYEGALRFASQEAMAGRLPMEGPLKVVVRAYLPIAESWSKKKRADAIAGRVQPTVKPDADNLIKVLDALNEVVWRDDKQIVHATIIKAYAERPRLTIAVSRIEEERLL